MSEDRLQRAVCQLLDAKRLLYCHVPNGGKRGKREAGRFVGLGVKRGVPDILIFTQPVCGACGVAIELKSKTGRVRPEQEKWLQDLRNEGWHTAVCQSIDQVIAVVRECYGR